MSTLKGLLCATGAVLLATAVVAPLPADAANLSFTGTFNRDDDVQLFTFSTTVESTITLRTWSYAGGVNSAGTAIPEGGFDPILTLFDATGAFIAENDDDEGDCVEVSPSAVTGSCFDTFFQSTIQPGSYTVSVEQFDNFSTGGNLSDGFDYSDAFFTSQYGCSNGQFCDVGGYNRSNAWAFDILNVDTAAVVPVPATIWLMLTGLAGLGWRLRRPQGA